MSQENISEYLNPSRFPRMAFGLKANSTLHRITLTPSNANPGETLYIEIPKLTDNMVIVPGSVFLVFNLAISGHENNTVVNNISRNLVKRQRVVFGGETLTRNHYLILLNSRYPLRLCLMLLSFLTQQNSRHTKSQILSWNTDAFPANFWRKKHKQLIKLITLFSMRTFFTIKPSHFQNQMTALLMNKSMSQEGQ